MPKNKEINAVPTPLLSWDIYAMHIYKVAREAQIKMDIEQLNSFRKNFSWAINFNDILNETYEALVLTDYNQTILWSSKGFYKMTGYSSQFAKGKTPKFLQGEKTSAEVKQQLKRNIYHGKTFSGDLINYRKNGEDYICNIKVHPLKNEKDEITHFLALEREVF